MTEQQRIERARLARLALTDFLAPAFDVVRAEYGSRLTAVCAAKPWATNEIAALANAARIVDEVQSQIEALVRDGDEARHSLDRAKRIEGMSPAKRRLLSIGA